MSNEQSASPRSRCGFAIAAIGNAIVVYTVMVYFTVVLPRLQGLLTQIGATGVLLFLFFSWLYRYVQLIRVEPGSPPGFDEALAEAAATGAERPNRCQRCEKAKPAGTHHCSRCNRCVLQMDHHCHHFQWILTLQLLGLLFVLVVHGWQLLLSAERLQQQNRLDWRRLPTHLVVTCLLALGLFIDMLVLASWHLYLSLTKQSTIEVWGRIFWDEETPKKSS